MGLSSPPRVTGKRKSAFGCLVSPAAAAAADAAAAMLGGQHAPASSAEEPETSEVDEEEEEDEEEDEEEEQGEAEAETDGLELGPSSEANQSQTDEAHDLALVRLRCMVMASALGAFGAGSARRVRLTRALSIWRLAARLASAQMQAASVAANDAAVAARVTRRAERRERGKERLGRLVKILTRVAPLRSALCRLRRASAEAARERFQVGASGIAGASEWRAIAALSLY